MGYIRIYTHAFTQALIDLFPPSFPELYIFGMRPNQSLRNVNVDAANIPQQPPDHIAYHSCGESLW